MLQRFTVLIQAVAAVGILVIAVISWIGQSTKELRLEMQDGFQAIRSDIHEMNGRLGRVVGQLRTLMHGID